MSLQLISAQSLQKSSTSAPRPRIASFFAAIKQKNQTLALEKMEKYELYTGGDSDSSSTCASTCFTVPAKEIKPLAEACSKSQTLRRQKQRPNSLSLSLFCDFENPSQPSGSSEQCDREPNASFVDFPRNTSKPATRIASASQNSRSDEETGSPATPALKRLCSEDLDLLL